jgi:hypothetical protein
MLNANAVNSSTLRTPGGRPRRIGPRIEGSGANLFPGFLKRMSRPLQGGPSSFDLRSTLMVVANAVRHAMPDAMPEATAVVMAVAVAVTMHDAMPAASPATAAATDFLGDVEVFEARETGRRRGLGRRSGRDRKRGCKHASQDE